MALAWTDEAVSPTLLQPQAQPIGCSQESVDAIAASLSVIAGVHATPGANLAVSTAIQNLTVTLCNQFNAAASSDATIITSSNVGFLLFSAYLVFVMQAGFACLCAGTIRAKNAKNIMLKNTLDAAAGAIAWYLVGYAFAFGVGGSPNAFIGNNWFALSNGFGAYDSYGLIHTWGSFVFQWAFAAAASTITIGSVAERTQMSAYIGFSWFLTGFVYPVVAHWAWSSYGWMSPWKSDGNFLFNVGYLDFAGSGVVHMVGGFAGLCGALVVGPRIGRFDANGKVVDMPGHSAPLVVLGTFLLWFGWYGFNPGSQQAIIASEEIVGRVAVTTTLSGGMAGFTTLVFKRVVYGQWDCIAVCNGVLAGLATITGGCAVTEPWAAIIIGGCAAIVFNYAIRLLWLLQIDDPLDAFPMHGACGAFGIFMIGLLAKQQYIEAVYPLHTGTPYGLFYGGGGKLLGAQIVGILVIAGWVSFLMTSFFFIMKMLNLLRVPADQELAGIDVSKHGGFAYPDEMYTGGGSKHGGDFPPGPIKLLPADNGTAPPAADPAP